MAACPNGWAVFLLAATKDSLVIIRHIKYKFGNKQILLPNLYYLLYTSYPNNWLVFAQ